MSEDDDAWLDALWEDDPFAQDRLLDMEIEARITELEELAEHHWWPLDDPNRKPAPDAFKARYTTGSWEIDDEGNLIGFVPKWASGSKEGKEIAAGIRREYWKNLRQERAKLKPPKRGRTSELTYYETPRFKRMYPKPAPARSRRLDFEGSNEDN